MGLSGEQFFPEIRAGAGGGVGVAQLFPHHHRQGRNALSHPAAGDHRDALSAHRAQWAGPCRSAGAPLLGQRCGTRGAVRHHRAGAGGPAFRLQFHHVHSLPRPLHHFCAGERRAGDNRHCTLRARRERHCLHRCSRRSHLARGRASQRAEP